MEVFGGRIAFFDSFRFIPTSLPRMPAMFGLDKAVDTVTRQPLVKKGWFLYRLNNWQQWSDIMPRPPSKDDFETRFMNAKTKEKFDAWYYDTFVKPEEDDPHYYLNADNWYDVFRENKEYCRNHVYVLHRCFMEFANSMHEMNGIWPGIGNLTIASYCNKVWHL